jgi:hypothetical protein
MFRLFAPILFALAADAAKAGDSFTTASGITLRTPSVDKLGCPEMRRVLEAIDASGYRRGAPRPEDETDMALFRYEDRLSSAYYGRCVADETRGAEAARAFRSGFGPEEGR